MFTKIQPEQIQLHTFSSPSGDFAVSQGSNFVNFDLRRELTGNFNFVGSVSSNGDSLLIDNSNSQYNPLLNSAFGGTGNTITGTGNVVLNSQTCDASGTYNLIANGYNSKTDKNSSRNFIVGRNVIVPSGVNGGVVLKDGESASIATAETNKLIVRFESGIEIQSNTLWVNADISLQDSSLVLDGGSILLVSGDSYFQNLYSRGEEVVRFSQLTGASGILNAKINTVSGYLTGQDGVLNTKIDVSSGYFTGVRANAVYVTGDQTINGNKTFQSGVLFLGSGQAPATSGSAGTVGTFVASGDFLFYCKAPSSWVRFSGASF